MWSVSNLGINVAKDIFVEDGKKYNFKSIEG